MIASAPTTAPHGRPIANFPLLTDAIGGLRGITVVGGQTGHAKSRLAANIVANVGGPALPVLYLDMENDDQVDEHGEPITRTVGDWIIEAYGRECPALETLYGYSTIEALDHDIPLVKPPALVVLDTVTAVVGQEGEQMRTKMAARVEWAKLLVRRGYLVLLVSQLNAFGAFKESRSLEEGAWTALTVRKAGDQVEVDVGKVRTRARVNTKVILRLDGARLTEVRAGGTSVRSEAGARLTALQRVVVAHGGRIGFVELMRARGFSLKRDSASRKRGVRELAAAVEACEIGHPERDVYTYPAPTSEDKTEDIASSADVPASPDANACENTPKEP